MKFTNHLFHLFFRDIILYLLIFIYIYILISNTDFYFIFIFNSTSFKEHTKITRNFQGGTTFAAIEGGLAGRSEEKEGTEN